MGSTFGEREVQLLKCQQCPVAKYFVTSERLQQHCHLQHPLLKPKEASPSTDTNCISTPGKIEMHFFKCKTCRAGFEDQEGLINHLYDSHSRRNVKNVGTSTGMVSEEGL